MREIKFRAWDKNLKEIFYRDNLTIFTFSESDHEFMQYTGLKDKNGVEIYEGDIIRWKLSYPPTTDMQSHELGRVEWDDDYAHFFIQHGDAHEDDYIPTKAEIEVIGNIYECPNLLESKCTKNL